MRGFPAIIAALPREIAGLVRGIRPESQGKQDGIFIYRLESGLAVCAGMGGERVTLAVQAALEHGAVSKLVSTGLAGGCDPAILVGTVIEPRIIVDTLSGVRFLSANSGAVGTLVTTHAVVGVKEKQRLFASYSATIVDMEAATVGRLAEAHGLPFQAIKAVSDGHDFELGSLSRFCSHKGHFRTSAFALHTALRPQIWRKTMRLGAGSQRALQALTEVLKTLCAKEMGA